MKFDEWFVKQYGKRPTTMQWSDLNSEYHDLEYKLTSIKELIDNTERWEELHTISRYAWNLKEEDKK